MDVAYGFNVCDVRMTRLGDWGLRLCTPKRVRSRDRIHVDPTNTGRAETLHEQCRSLLSGSLLLELLCFRHRGIIVRGAAAGLSIAFSPRPEHLPLVSCVWAI